MKYIFLTAFENQDQLNYEYDFVPDKCPICHNNIQPIFRYAYSYEETKNIISKKSSQAVFQCPNFNCYKFFIVIYENDPRFQVFNAKKVYPIESQKLEFSESINKLSPKFSEIFNQSYVAEQQELLQICGAGYRKALEFLIKDFAIKNAVNDEEIKKIKKKLLSSVINDHISDSNIKKVANRASWLGNDETHYLRIWEQHDLNDLKTLIKLTTNWIENIDLTEKYEASMPSN